MSRRSMSIQVLACHSHDDERDTALAAAAVLRQAASRPLRRTRCAGQGAGHAVDPSRKLSCIAARATGGSLCSSRSVEAVAGWSPSNARKCPLAPQRRPASGVRRPSARAVNDCQLSVAAVVQPPELSGGTQSSAVTRRREPNSCNGSVPPVGGAWRLPVRGGGLRPDHACLAANVRQVPRFRPGRQLMATAALTLAGCTARARQRRTHDLPAPLATAPSGSVARTW
jgi:hypothetical protein